MLGQIYSFDPATHSGFILGQDGYRYGFVPEDFAFQTDPIVGMIVQFEPGDNAAHDITTLDRLPIQSRGTRPDTKLDADMQGWSPPLPIPETRTAGSSNRRRGSVPPAGKRAPTTASGDWMGMDQAGPESDQAGFNASQWNTPPQNFPQAPQADLQPNMHQASPGIQRTNVWGHFKRCMTVNYGQFHGRASRTEFWSFHIVFWVMSFGALLIAGASSGDENTANIGVLLPGLFILAGIIPSLAVLVRRLHDVGITGFAALVILIPWLGFLAWLAFGIIPGQADNNQHGPPPPK